MKVDFWQISRDPPARVVALIAARVLAQGERLLVVSADAEQRQLIAKALWAAGPESFLANGHAGAAGEERQPILLSDVCEAPNGASHVVFADGAWRESTGFARLFLLFGEDTLDAARGTWRTLAGAAGVERSFYRQDGGRWTKIA
ncbi:DNA polymerase III subunit chi [Erythrobacter sp. HL-111]|uniref:DNA polymerase III subunit chi n=1 Tax=Erythrobacter sp. HL-111 TaxID=1798193 RepID=UPI0006DB5506|nr:DNA polymerase III subunit chi [Erythrobacter sp. HL-111]KPP91496.1 MAG: DNA polymerase III chi subunit HolC [Erythrobacteraceae bacterium HL-111]SDS24534.1 DNA polymerase III, chi subunit [Erythrobacter sp. HL-111]